MKAKKRVLLLFVIAGILLILSMAIAIMSGSYSISIDRVVKTLLGDGTMAENFAILQIRLPRMVIAILVGLALSASGCILQTITKNPLAEPGMIGMNAGAAFAVVVFLTLQKSTYYEVLSMNKILLMPLVAMLGGILASVVIFLLAYRGGITPVRLILVGIGVNSGINAIISYYMLTSSKGDYNQVLTWTSGSLWGSSWMYVKLVAPVIIVLLVVLFCKSRVLDALQLGEEMATGLGIQTKREIIFFFFLAAILAAVATAVAGNIAFLGLIGPQLAKRLVGGRHKLMIPLGGLISAIILILADTAARNLFSPVEIPVGIAVSIIGVPYFIYLLIKEK